MGQTPGTFPGCFSSLRDTFTFNIIMDGVDLYVVKELLGHKSLKMSMKYAHLSREHKANAVYALDKIFVSMAKTGVIKI